MRLSAPIYRLKRQAKALSKENGIALNVALDHVAKDEGFPSWSLLAAQYASESPASSLLAKFEPGDLVLLGARPGQGKTLMGLELAVQSVKDGNKATFFSLEYTKTDIAGHLNRLGADISQHRDALMFDTSDDICADYIIGKLSAAQSGTLVVIDYLQILDQKRHLPAINVQIASLKSFAIKAGLIVVCISQIDRAFDQQSKKLPGINDVRLPNPLDLTMFNKTCFLNEGELTFANRGNPG